MIGSVISLDAFKGRWKLSRVIEDRRAGLTGRLEGEAIWTPDGDGGLLQQESGVLHYGDAAPMQATRTYLWRVEGAGIAVFFEDGRPFHTLPEAGQDAVHHCDPDLYRVTYHFDLPGAFTQTWRVTGPRKDTFITSRFQRL